MTNAMEFATKEQQAKITQMMVNAFNDLFYGSSGQDRGSLATGYKDLLLRISQLMYKEQASGESYLLINPEIGLNFMICMIDLLDAAEEIAFQEKTIIQEHEKLQKRQPNDKHTKADVNLVS